MNSDSHPIIIIGAGMAGLSCATWLHRAGRPVLVLEAADAVGGRVRTDLTPEGFRLDRGFQVLQTNYPEARRLFDYGALHLKAFRSGAVIRLPDGAQTTLQNPLKNPLSAFSALTSPIGSLADKLRIVSLVRHVLQRTPEELLARPDAEDTVTFLRRYGFSELMIDTFFRPFFGGVFLDRGLTTASNFFEFIFQQFVTGDAAIPALGIQELPEQLANRLPAGSVRLDTSVAGIVDGSQVRLTTGQVLQASAIVLATDGLAALRLLAGRSGNPDDTPTEAGSFPTAARITTCTYFATPGGHSPGRNDKLLRLNAAPNALAHNVAFPADVSGAYAPAGRSLISVSTHGERSLEEAELVPRLRRELAAWFGPAARDWEHLRTYRIAAALPVYPAGQPPRQPLKLADYLYRCGDWASYPSLNGALATGREVAELIIKG
ncbi:MAG: FAD-dependent oxidoreductase [Bacteroidota bacterium]|nr:FAD-dependent oxidoreductase [Bacteroidota bacterium]